MTEERNLRPFNPDAHCLEGGTFITNLDKDYIPFVEQAVKEFGDPRFIIHDKPCRGGLCMADQGWKSLHYLGDEPKLGRWNGTPDLSPMWRNAERLRDRHKEWLKLKDFAP